MPQELPPRAATEDRGYYDREYYEYYNGLGPYTRERWLPFFRRVAAGIVADAHPRTAIEYGCAKGFLVEALRELGVEAYGVDFSPHAIAEVYEPIRPYCRVGDVREPAGQCYDVAICMEVLEHLDERDALTAVRTLAEAANVVYFSSNPDEDFPEATHANVQPPEYWEGLFERAGMVRDRAFDPTFIADWALKFERKPVEIILPVYNSPRHTRWCLESLYQQTDPRLFHLLLVDDGSDDFTKRLLREYATTRSNVTLLTNETNQGFLPAVNRALAETRAPYVVLLNSDVLLTPGWLERLLAAPAGDPTIGLACSLSNNAENLSVAMPPGYSYLDTAALIATRGQRRYPDAMTVVGFCLLIARPVLDALGGFDPLFGRGYVEEADYQFRALAAGFRAVVVDDCYVYHTREASFGDYLPHWLRNYPLFEARWGAAFKAGLARFEATGALGYLRDASTRQVANPPELTYDVVYYLPPTMGGVGGMISVVEIANRLIRRGLKVAVAHTGPWAVTAESLFTPLAYASDAAFAGRPPRAKVIVATGYQTVEPVAAACRRFSAEAAYFIQDYEGYFDNGANLSAAAATYERIPTRIAVSRWVQALLRDQHGVESTVIPLGCATDEFYPRPVAPPALAEARAAGKMIAFGLLRADDRRGAPYLLELARRLEASCPEIVFAFAGHNAPPDRPNILGLGLLNRRDMSCALAASDVVLDASLYQGFGMLAIEAMASGVATVLTDNGGCREYAEDEVNCLLVPPRDVRALAEALQRLHHDPALRRRLGAAGRATAERFDWDGIAARHAEVYAPLIARAHLDERRYLLTPPPAPPRPPQPPITIIYRCFDGLDHLYTADPAEARQASYAVEGRAFAVYRDPGDGLRPLHRLRQQHTGDHLYTTDPGEPNAVGYRDEGTIGFVAAEERPGVRPLYRGYRPRTRDHLYSLEETECDRNGYRPEGIAGYVPDVPLDTGGIVSDGAGGATTPLRRLRLAPRYARLALPVAAPLVVALTGVAAWLVGRRARA